MKRLTYIILFSIFLISQASAQVVVIAHKDVAESAIDKAKLADVFTMDKTTWSDGKSIVLVELGQDGDTKNAFLGYIGKSKNDLKKAWMKKMLSGEGQAPEALGSEDAVVQKVASTPGAIGYVSKSKVSGDVKVLLEIN